jgi:hypothetical protein
MKEQIDEITIELHYLLNAISELPDGDYKKALWDQTQKVCDVLIYSRESE